MIGIKKQILFSGRNAQCLKGLNQLSIIPGSITNQPYGTVAMEDISPVSTNSPDPESTSFCPFDEEQLPHELADAMYDPRMFFNKEVYFDPDIIGKIIAYLEVKIWSLLKHEN